MRQKLKPNAEDTDWLKAVIIALNDQHPLRRSEMRRLTKGWQDAGRDAAKMLRMHPELKPYLFDSLGRPSCRAVLIPKRSGLRAIPIIDGPSNVTGRDELIKDEVRLMFMHFLLIDPTLREKLSQEPCPRCGDYFPMNTSRQTVYCSRKCGKVGTAAFATRERLKSEHAEKLRVAAEQAQLWDKTRTQSRGRLPRDDWKHWVSKQPAGRKFGVTPKFLTRAVNKGELAAPQRSQES